MSFKDKSIKHLIITVIILQIIIIFLFINKKQEITKPNEIGSRKSISVCDEVLKLEKIKEVNLFDGIINSINFEDQIELKKIHSVINEQISDGPNFAGHFNFIKWGCGTSCINYVIVDANSGKIIFQKHNVENLNPSFDIKSRLLVFNPKDDFSSQENKTINEIIQSASYETGKGREYYIIDEDGENIRLYKVCTENAYDGIYYW